MCCDFNSRLDMNSVKKKKWSDMKNRWTYVFVIGHFYYRHAMKFILIINYIVQAPMELCVLIEIS